MTDVRVLRRARPERRAHPALLPLHRHLERPLHRARRRHRLHATTALGILSFSNELWNGDQYFTSPELKEQQKDPDEPHRPGRSRATSSTTTSSSATSSSSGSPSTIRSSATVEIGGVWKKFQAACRRAS
ncbi:MAG: hypothetical protein MZW92_10170 [Comamonadaceae bacterium]|nr:hypothetical protein [Comamonadaceae bacterium]